jgi:hypothetical protein
MTSYISHFNMGVVKVIVRDYRNYFNHKMVRIAAYNKGQMGISDH